MSNKAEFSKGIKQVYKELKEEEKELEKLDEKIKEVLKLSSSSIKHIHNNELKKAERLIEKAKGIVENTDWKDYIIAQQEFVEAYSLLLVEKERRIPAYPMKNIPPRAYLNGILDLVGELKRKFLIAMLKKDLDRARFYYKIVEFIYNECSTIVLTNRVVPEFRRKLDSARFQLNQMLTLLVEKSEK